MEDFLSLKIQTPSTSHFFTNFLPSNRLNQAWPTDTSASELPAMLIKKKRRMCQNKRSRGTRANVPLLPCQRSTCRTTNPIDSWRHCETAQVGWTTAPANNRLISGHCSGCCGWKSSLGGNWVCRNHDAHPKKLCTSQLCCRYRIPYMNLNILSSHAFQNCFFEFV